MANIARTVLGTTYLNEASTNVVSVNSWLDNSIFDGTHTEYNSTI